MSSELIITIGADRDNASHIAYFYSPRESDGRCIPDPGFSMLIQCSNIPSRHQVDVRVGHTPATRFLEWLQKEGLTNGHIRFYETHDFSQEEITMIETLMGHLANFTYEYFGIASTSKNSTRNVRPMTDVDRPCV
mgnify:CR=1 FL=1